MYYCYCNKKHELNDDHFNLIDEGKEIHLCCTDCDWQIIVGADLEPEGYYMMYSRDVEDEKDTIGKITSFSKPQ